MIQNQGPHCRIRDLHVSFSGRPVLNNLNLDVSARSITVILGRSGSGKTTLLRSINRLNECFPACSTSGSIMIALDRCEIDILGPQSPPVHEIRRQIGMVFQAPHVLPMSIEKNILLPLALAAGIKGEKAQNLMEKALHEAELWAEVCDRLQSAAESLSGGQQQRLCLARTLALDPGMLLLDEPTASVDFVAAQKIESLLLALKSHYTILVVSHSLAQTRRIADHILIMREGRIVEQLGREVFAQTDMLERLIEEAL